MRFGTLEVIHLAACISARTLDFDHVLPHDCDIVVRASYSLDRATPHGVLDWRRLPRRPVHFVRVGPFG